MRQKLLLIFILTFTAVTAQEVTHIDFDSNNANIVFNSWNTSSTFAKVANPAEDTVNPSAFVGQFTAGDDNGIGIGVIDVKNVFTSPFNLVSNPIFKMKVFSTEEIDVIFHLENDPDWGNNIEVSASVGAADINKWVELTFDFSENASNIYMDNIVIKIGGANTSQGDIYFFDDIKGPEMYTSPAYEYNPANAAVDISISTNLDISTNDKFRDLDDSEITDLIGKVALRIGDSNGTDVPFSASINGDKNRITIDPTNDLDNSMVYWYGVVDNAIEHTTDELVSGVSATFTTKEAVSGDVNEMLFDFDTTNQDVGFESWGGTGFEKIANPDKSGINTSDNVAKYTHAGNDSGLENSLVNGATPLTPFDFSETPFIKVKVWVSKPVGVSIKLQNYPDWGQGHEQKIDVTETNQWVELVFNYGSITATNYDRAQIYFDKDRTGGSVAGDTFYFDDYLKSNVAPAVETQMIPADATTEVSQTAVPTISSNFQFVLLDGSTITDVSPYVELREGDASGTLVATTSSINDAKNSISIKPSDLLNANTQYWFGIKDNMIKYKENDTNITGTSATFTTQSTAISFTTYNDFDGTTVTAVSETMGDPAGAFTTVADPAGGTNMVAQWDKGNSWGGWERIHFQLNAAFDATKDDIFSFKVYSPVKTGIRFKVADAKDDGDITAQFETDEEIVLENQWQTVYLNTSDLADGVSFDHIFIFLGRGASGDTTFYIDDVKGPQLQGAASVNDFEKTKFSFYPNPSNNTIRFSNLDTDKLVKIYDINSKNVLSKMTKNSELSISNLNTGLYFVEIEGNFQKLIKK